MKYLYTRGAYAYTSLVLFPKASYNIPKLGKVLFTIQNGPQFRDKVYQKQGKTQRI